MAKRIAVVLSGCGHRDGAEITEAVSTLVALGENGAEFKVFAPDVEVLIKDHRSGESSGEKRNALVEAARIARGQIEPLSELKEADFDGLAIPGGMGAAQVLGSSELMKKIILAFYMAEKPIAAICIAPTLLAEVLGEEGVTLTIGNDKETATKMEKQGAVHEDCKVEDFISDREHKVVTTPAYMYSQAKPHQVFQGISKAIKELVEMA